MTNLHFRLDSLAATAALAADVAAAVRRQPAQQTTTIALNGTLGAGKTQWVRFFCTAFGVPSEAVTSPTYVLLQRYAAERTLHHYDFYRLESAAQVWDLGIDEVYEQPGVVLIEWARKFPECLPDDFLEIELTQVTANQRSARCIAHGSAAEQLLACVQSQSQLPQVPIDAEP